MTSVTENITVSGSNQFGTPLIFMHLMSTVYHVLQTLPTAYSFLTVVDFSYIHG